MIEIVQEKQKENTNYNKSQRAYMHRMHDGTQSSHIVSDQSLQRLGNAAQMQQSPAFVQALHGGAGNAALRALLQEAHGHVVLDEKPPIDFETDAPAYDMPPQFVAPTAVPDEVWG